MVLFEVSFEFELPDQVFVLNLSSSLVGFFFLYVFSFLTLLNLFCCVVF